MTQDIRPRTNNGVLEWFDTESHERTATTAPVSFYDDFLGTSLNGDDATVAEAAAAAALEYHAYPERDEEGDTVVDRTYPYGNVYRYGATGLGVANDREAFQAASDAAEALGLGKVTVPEGAYLIGPGAGATPPSAGDYSIQLGDGVILDCDPNAVIIRNFTGANGSFDSLIRNKDMVAGNARVGIVGGRLKADNALHTGKLVSFFLCTDVRLDATRFEGVYSDWNTNFRDCDDVIVSNVVMDSGDSVFEDGLHFQGCQRVQVANCSITCGDDALALVESGSLATRDCTDIHVSNCYFESRAANAIKIRAETGQTPSARAIRRVLISNCNLVTGGGAGNPGLYIEDLTNTGIVSDIQLSNVVLDASANNAEPRINGAVRVTLKNVKILSPRDRLRIDNATDVELNNVEILGLRGASQQCVYISSGTGPCTNVRITGGHYKGATAAGILIGSGANATDCLVDGPLVEDCTGDGITVGADADGGVRVMHARCKNNGGWGINVSASAAAPVGLYDNDLRNNTSGGHNATSTNTTMRGNRFTTDKAAGTVSFATLAAAIDSTDVHIPLPGLAAGSIDCPTLSVTGKITLIARIAPATWVPAIEQTIMGKWLTTGNQRSFDFRLRTDGKLILFWSTTGVSGDQSAQSSVATGFAANVEKYVAVEFDPDNGANRVIKFYTSDDGVAWTQLGTTTTSTQSTYFDSTATLTVGTNLEAKLRYAALRSGGLTDTLVRVANVGLDALHDATSWVSSATGETWTVHGSAGSKKTVKTLEVRNSNIRLTRTAGLGSTRGMPEIGAVVSGSYFEIDIKTAAAARETGETSTFSWEIVH